MNSFIHAGLNGSVPVLPEKRFLISRREPMVQFTRDWLRSADAPTAVIVDTAAEFVWYTAESLGLCVPRNLSLISFSTGMETTYVGRPITTVRIRERELGHMAVRRLLEKISDSREHLKPATLPYELADDGQTVGPPRT
jgi:DNA-binding LacI/PurR family transcriptional regulator